MNRTLTVAAAALVALATLTGIFVARLGPAPAAAAEPTPALAVSAPAAPTRAPIAIEYYAASDARATFSAGWLQATATPEPTAQPAPAPVVVSAQAAPAPAPVVYSDLERLSTAQKHEFAVETKPADRPAPGREARP